MNKLEVVKLDLAKEKKEYGTLYPQNFLISLIDFGKKKIPISKKDYETLQQKFIENKTQFLLNNKSKKIYTTGNDGNDYYLWTIQEYCENKIMGGRK